MAHPRYTQKHALQAAKRLGKRVAINNPDEMNIMRFVNLGVYFGKHGALTLTFRSCVRWQKSGSP